MATENNKEEIKQDSQTEDRSAGDMPKDESAGDMPKDESAGDMQKGASASDMPKGKPAGSMQEKTEPEGAGTDADAAASPDPGTAGVQKREEPAPNAGNSSGYMDPGAKWAAENAKATGADVEKNMKSAGIPGHIVMILAAVLLIILCAVIYVSQKPEENAPGQASTAETAGTQKQSMGAREETGETANTAGQAQTAASGSTAGAEKSVALSPGMKALDKKLRKDLSEKNGDWSLYLYCLDNGQEIGINANEPMISASLIKLYVAGCYFEQVEKGNIQDNSQSLIYSMLSASDNSATNRLIDILGMDEINSFMEEHNYKAGKLNRKMLEKNGTENYTSARDCGSVLRSVYEAAYINKDASEKIEEAMRDQIARNRYKIPAGVPEDVDTANKTGELFTTNSEGVSVDVQNDAAIIYAKDHPYILVVMTAVHGAGEGEMHEQIAEISAEVYKAVTDAESEEVSSKEAATEEAAAEGTSKEAATEAAAEEGTSKEAATEEAAAEGTSRGAASEEAAAKGTSR